MKYAAFAFPAGPAGVALALLRASVCISLCAATWELPPQAPWPRVVFWAVGLAVGAGVLTRAAALAAAASGLALALVTGSGEGAFCMTAPTLAAGALAILGPGAFSVDGFRFGRQTLRLPR